MMSKPIVSFVASVLTHGVLWTLTLLGTSGVAGAANVISFFWGAVALFSLLGLLIADDDMLIRMKRNELPAALRWSGFGSSMCMAATYVWHGWFVTAVALLLASTISAAMRWRGAKLIHAGEAEE